MRSIIYHFLAARSAFDAIAYAVAAACIHIAIVIAVSENDSALGHYLAALGTSLD